MSIFDAAMKYAETRTPLVILAGHEYGTGSSRDWAAKGTRLLGVKAVIAASFERIHRSNLVGMGVLPLQFLDGTSAQSLGLDGSEKFSITRLSDRSNQANRSRSRSKRTDKSNQCRLSCGSIRRSKSIIIGTAEFCRSSCDNCYRSNSSAISAAATATTVPAKAVQQQARFWNRAQHQRRNYLLAAVVTATNCSKGLSPRKESRARIEAEIAVRRYQFGTPGIVATFSSCSSAECHAHACCTSHIGKQLVPREGCDRPSSKATAWLERNRLLRGKGINDFFEARIATQRIPKRQ